MNIHKIKTKFSTRVSDFICSPFLLLNILCLCTISNLFCSLLSTRYQDTLPQLIKGRKEQMLLYDEIVQVTKWKLLRGKFRPSILDLVRTNTESAVKNVTKKAFKKMPNINAAITALTQLKGIAPATASGKPPVRQWRL